MRSNPSAQIALIIDDEVQIRRLLRICLERSGYSVVEAATGEAGIGEAAARAPNVVLLDLGLPDIDGLIVLQRLREWTSVPIMVLSVRGQEDDKITALDHGADDYVTKPFSTREVLARLRVIQRRTQSPAKVATFRTGRLEVDLVARTVRCDGALIRLTATEYALLHLLVQHAGKVLTHGFILRQIWGEDGADKTGYLRVYISHLRDKIEAAPGAPELLVTEPGIGYRLSILD